MANRITYSFKRVLKGFEFVFKRFVVWTLGLFFTTEPKSARNIKSDAASSAKRVLFLRFDKLGDMVVSLPVFETLSREAPNIQVEVLASPANQVIIAHDSRVSSHWIYSKRPWRDLSVLWALRKRQYDAVVDMICLDSVTALFISQFVGRKVMRVGIGKSRFAKYYTHNIPLNTTNYEHIVDSTLGVVGCLGIAEERFISHTPLATTKDAQVAADNFIMTLRGVDGATNKPLIGVNISAGQPNRMWGKDNFGELLERLMDSAPQPIVCLICAPPDRDLAESIRREIACEVGIVPAGLDILQVSALIERLDLLISPDTSLIHIARQYDVPVVGLYPTHGRSAAQWRPHRQLDGMVQGGSDCDIHDITPEQVMAEYRKVSGRTFLASRELRRIDGS